MAFLKDLALKVQSMSNKLHHRQCFLLCIYLTYYT